MCAGRRGGDLDASCSHCLTAVFLDFKIGFQTGSCITKGKKKKRRNFPWEVKKF